jgi:hypothetical protein
MAYLSSWRKEYGKYALLKFIQNDFLAVTQGLNMIGQRDEPFVLEEKGEGCTHGRAAYFLAYPWPLVKVHVNYQCNNDEGNSSLTMVVRHFQSREDLSSELDKMASAVGLKFLEMKEE